MMGEKKADILDSAVGNAPEAFAAATVVRALCSSERVTGAVG